MINSRITTYHTIAPKLESLNDQNLLELLEKSVSIHFGMGGTSVLLKIDGINIFVKKVPLTDVEILPENIMSTENIFELPTYYQYGIGSAGFGAWRELSAHIMSTEWVLRKDCPNFPLMYHWRILPDSTLKTLPTSVEGYSIRSMYQHPTTDSLNLIKQGELGLFCEGDKLYCKAHNKEKIQIIRADNINIQGIDPQSYDKIIKTMHEEQSQEPPENIKNITEAEKAEVLEFASLHGYIPEKLERLVEYWGGSSTIRARLEAREKASANLVLFLEYIPETLQQWLDRQFIKGNITDSMIAMVESDLKAITSFVSNRGLLHFDANFMNILTDGHRLYLTDFGLATSSIFKLSKTEIKFIEAHRDYDQRYIAAMWVNWIGTTIFGKKNIKAKLHEYIAGKGEELVPFLAKAIIIRDAQHWIAMNMFFKDLKNEIRSGKVDVPPVAWASSRVSAVNTIGNHN